MPRIFIALLFTLPFLIATTAPGMADIEGKRTMSVTGVGIAKARPDTARISIGVVSEGKTAREALDKNSAAMNRVIAELKKQQIEAKDIQTSDFSVRPKFQHFKDGRPPEIVGYRVVNSVNIVVRDLDGLGGILDQIVSHGSNQINGIQFTVDDSGAMEDEARRKAMADARHKAELYAGAGNARLGQVLTINENLVSRPPQPIRARAAFEAKAASVPIEAGEHEVQARVNVTWELMD